MQGLVYPANNNLLIEIFLRIGTLLFQLIVCLFSLSVNICKLAQYLPKTAAGPGLIIKSQAWRNFS